MRRKERRDADVPEFESRWNEKGKGMANSKGKVRCRRGEVRHALNDDKLQSMVRTGCS